MASRSERSNSFSLPSRVRWTSLPQARDVPHQARDFAPDHADRLHAGLHDPILQSR